MTDELSKHGLYFDYLYNLRVLDPNIASDTSDLKEKSGEYNESECKFKKKKLLPARFTHRFTIELQEFRKIIDEFIDIAETIVSDVEQEKSQAIAAQNQLKSMAKQREAEQQDIQVKCSFSKIRNKMINSIFFCFSFARTKSMKNPWNWNN